MGLIMICVVALGLAGTLSGDQIFALVSAIVGYVFGRVHNRSDGRE